VIAGDWPLDRRLVQQIVHPRGTSDGVVRGVHVEHEVHNNDHQDESVTIIAQECSTKTTQDHICADTGGDEEDRGVDVHSCQSSNDGTSTEE